MKSFHLTVWTIITLFVLIMGGVAGTAFVRKTNSCKLDPAHMRTLREMAKR